MDWNARHAAQKQGRTPSPRVVASVYSGGGLHETRRHDHPWRQGHLGPHDQRANTLQGMRRALPAALSPRFDAAAAALSPVAGAAAVAPNDAAPAQSVLLRDIAARGDEVHLRQALGAPDCPDIDEPSRSGMTALHCASDRGQERAVRLLLEREANAGAVTDSGDTPLHLACLNGHLATCKVLLVRFCSSRF